MRFFERGVGREEEGKFWVEGFVALPLGLAALATGLGRIACRCKTLLWIRSLVWCA